MGSLLVIWRYVQGRLEHHIVREAHMSPCKKGWSRFGRMIWSKSPLENEIAAHHLTLCWRFSLFENRSNSFSAVWAARIPIKVPFVAELHALHEAHVRSRRSNQKGTLSVAPKMPRAKRATQNESEPPFVLLANSDKGDKKSIFPAAGPPMQHSNISRRGTSSGLHALSSAKKRRCRAAHMCENEPKQAFP